MAYVVASPGSCGEFIQGYKDGASFMVTCPVNRYALAASGEGVAPMALPEKAEAAREKTLSYLGREGDMVPVRLLSAIQPGKGMASSTADISAVAQATALACGRTLTDRELAAIALSIEPSDATFFEGIVQFDYRKGTLIRELGHAPALDIVIYDCGGEVDTCAFNSRRDLISLQQENEPATARALALFQEGLRTKSPALIGQAATISAIANQKILFKKELIPFMEAGMAAGGLGVIAAHSGTVLGLIIPAGAEDASVRQGIEAALGDGLVYLDTVSLTNEGMTIKECDSRELSF